MDLTKLSIRKATGKPAALHLKHPFTGEPLYADKAEKKPVRMMLLGAECEAFKDKGKEIEKRKAKGEEIADDQAGAEALAVLITGWENIGLGSTADLEFSYENAVKLLMHPDTDWIVRQIGPFVGNLRNYQANLSGT